MLLLTVLATVFISTAPVFANPVCGSTITVTTTLTGNIGPCAGIGLIIGANSITLNCNGYTISGTNTNYGISIMQWTKVKIENCVVTNATTGFYAFNVTQSTFSSNIARNNTLDGFAAVGSRSNTYTENVADNNGINGFAFCGTKCGGNAAPVCSGNKLTLNTADYNKGDGFVDTTCKTQHFLGNWGDSNGGLIGPGSTGYGYDTHTDTGDTSPPYNYCMNNITGGSYLPGVSCIP